MPVEDDDLDLDLEDDDDDAAAAAAAKAAEEKAAAEKAAADKAAAAAAATDDQTKQLAELGLTALKASFVEAAKAAGHVAADFDGIGLKGIDEAGKAAFLAEAKASHEAKVDALKAQGFVFNPEAASAAGQAAQLDAQDAALRQAWGPAGPGQQASGDEKFTAQVKDEVAKGDTMGVIGSLMGEGGLGAFFIRGRR